ncbi:MAG: extracellular solute-binding protein [Bacilli bacterium]|nr:extracellular solute-binding protein [Bacilli bacterium]
MSKIRAVLLLFLIMLLSGCSSHPKLLLLNWGEYINEEVVELFEKETGIDVIINIADSNEMFYSKLLSGTTVYDLIIPSEYMVDKMVSKGLLQKINFDLLANYNLETNPFMPGVTEISESMFPEFSEYTVPYFWGTFGLMYNKNKGGLEEAILTHGWDAYFDESLRPEGTSIGMYDVPRFAYAAALLAEGESPNIFGDEALSKAEKKLREIDYQEWGTDTLKKGIAANNLDLAFVYTGDFLDILYIKLETNALEDISFDIYIPDNTIAFMDSFVIPKKARHLEEAHKFIDFFLDKEMAYLNASVIGYCTPLLATYQMITSYQGDDAWLNAWAYANKVYYPLLDEGSSRQYQGTPLKNLDREFLRKINIMINNVKADNE